VVLDAEKGGWKEGVEFFRAENTVDYLISRLADGNMANGKPCIAQVAIMDGIVMGGGAGLAMHSQFRVATEKYDSNIWRCC
jgi:enoyl-CoA hydratase/carnithine racemase